MSVVPQIFAYVLAVSAVLPPTPPPETNRAALLDGVTEIAATGAPGEVIPFGPFAFSVVTGKEGKEQKSSVVAASLYEKGRIVVFGHNGYLNATQDSGTGRLLLNAARWCGNGNAKIAVRKQPALLKHLNDNKISAEALDGANWLKDLSKYRVLCVDSHSIGSGDLPELTKWLRSGGGLVTAATGWGWASLNPTKKLTTDLPANQLLASAGLVISSGTPDKTTATGYAVGAEPDLRLLTASTALDALVAFSEKREQLTPAQLAQAAGTVSSALRAVPPSDTVLLPRIAALQTKAAFPQPGPTTPVRASDPIARLLITQNVQALKDAKPEQIRPHPAGDAFPGAVPKEAPRVASKVIEVDTSVRDWHSTGLYAPPGALIQVKVPANAVDKSLAIRIGSHTDSLWHLDTWKRVPEISRVEKITAVETKAANPFGGLVYIVVPKGCSLGKIAVSISGAVESPLFTLGKTSASDWMKIRNAPGPWAELATSKVILTVPSTVVRNLDDPESLMKFWDQALDAIADLATISRDRERPERIVADVEISAGYMHSGYPIMTHLDVAQRAVTLPELKQNGWGFWHELGHNHQASDWTFGGTTEVTCNLFSLYVSETLCGKPPGTGHDAMESAKVENRLKQHVASSASFERWKNDPFLALIMYNQLRQEFGWATYKKVFAEYRDLAKSERPKSDEEKHDQWMVRFSRAVGKNLGPFFQKWGVPTSDSARASIASLPEWMPSNWPN